MRFVVSILLMALAFDASAGTVVWLEDDLPGDKQQEKADTRTGGTDHVAADALLWPATPVEDADDKARSELLDAIADAKKRWHDFEVEHELAMALEERLLQVGVIDDEKTQQAVVEALVLQGAAVHVAYEPDEFRDGDRARPFRVAGVGTALNRPWLEAIAFDPSYEASPADIADGATLPALKKALEAAADSPTVVVSLPDPPDATQWVVDGRVADADSVSFAPGRHFVHLVNQEGTVRGRRVLEVEDGSGSVAVEPYVSAEDLSAARGRLASGSTTGFPDSVRAALERVAADRQGQVFVGSMVDGKMTVLPYAHGASLVKQRPITVVTTGSVGAGLVVSTVFDDRDGEEVGAPIAAVAATGGVGIEVAYKRVFVMGGVDTFLTPGKTVTYANAANEANIDTSVLWHPHVGGGLYIMRPTGSEPMLSVAAHWGWVYPSHFAVGGRAAFGTPIRKDGDTWLRFELGALYSGNTSWGTDDTLMAPWLRFGFASRL